MRNREKSLRLLGLRLPRELVETLELLAEAHYRSLNAEIVVQLSEAICRLHPDRAQRPGVQSQAEREAAAWATIDALTENAHAHDAILEQAALE